MERACIEANWPAPRSARALATTRRAAGASQPPYDRCNLGVRSGDDADVVAANRAGLTAALGLPSVPTWLHQVHGREVLRVLDAPQAPASPEREPIADAAVTDRPGIVLAVLSADCLPVLFAADDGSAAGAAHAGWRGLSAGVLESVVAAMPVAPDRLLAWLGPAIGPGAYEVGDEVRETFLDRDADAAGAFAATRPGHWLCDLYALARLHLRRAGVERVFGGGLCTFSDPSSFYSHRRDGARSGRQAALIWLQHD